MLKKSNKLEDELYNLYDMYRVKEGLTPQEYVAHLFTIGFLVCLQVAPSSADTDILLEECRLGAKMAYDKHLKEKESNGNKNQTV